MVGAQIFTFRKSRRLILEILWSMCLPRVHNRPTVLLLICIFTAGITIAYLCLTEFYAWLFKSYSDIICPDDRHTGNRVPLNLMFSESTFPVSFIFDKRHCNSNISTTTPYLFFIVVYSIPESFKTRFAIRKTWAARVLQSRLGKVFFLINSPSNNKLVLSNLQREQKTHNDLLLVKTPIPDRYEYLSIKSLFLLKWFSSECYKADFLIKVDSDTFWNPDLLSKLLKDNRNRTVLMGNVVSNGIVRRDPRMSWFTYDSEFNQSFFPTYLNGGPGYIVSNTAAGLLYAAALNQQVFWLEDVFITGILAERSGIRRISVDGFSPCKSVPLERQRYEKIVAGHYILSDELLILWKKIFPQAQFSVT